MCCSVIYLYTRFIISAMCNNVLDFRCYIIHIRAPPGWEVGSNCIVIIRSNPWYMLVVKLHIHISRIMLRPKKPVKIQPCRGYIRIAWNLRFYIIETNLANIILANAIRTIPNRIYHIAVNFTRRCIYQIATRIAAHMVNWSRFWCLIIAFATRMKVVRLIYIIFRIHNHRHFVILCIADKFRVNSISNNVKSYVYFFAGI